MKNSLQLRLSLGLALGVGLLWFAASAVTGYIVTHELDEAFDQALVEAVQRLLPPIIHDIVEGDDKEREDDAEEGGRGELRLGRIGRSWRRIEGVPGNHLKRKNKNKRDEEDDHKQINLETPVHQYLTYLVRDAEGNILLQSQNAKADKFPPVTLLGFVTTPDYRVYTGTALDGNVVISVADPIVRRKSAARDTLQALASPLFILVPLSVLGGWLLVRLSMRSIRGFRAEIEARGGGDLTPISPGDLPTEIEPLAEAVNNLLDRMRRTLQAERSFTANSAHELRTPVAAALAQTQRLIAEAEAQPIKERAAQIETALKSLSKLTEKLMQLARAEGGGVLSEQPHDIMPVLKLVLDEFREGAERLEIDLPEKPVFLSIDANTFAILARNLIENALKHGPADGVVNIRLSPDGRLIVTNDCEPIPPDQLDRLTRPFERGRTRAKGSGVGLAIVSAIVAGSGSSLALKSPATAKERGFEVCISFKGPDAVDAYSRL